eukprot:10632965-Lingulodinium_polyedra.AAC.1
MEKVGLPAATLSDWRPSLAFGRELAVLAPYVDNGNVVAGCPDMAGKVMDAFKAELAAVGFQLHDEVLPTDQMEL